MWICLLCWLSYFLKWQFSVPKIIKILRTVTWFNFKGLWSRVRKRVCAPVDSEVSEEISKTSIVNWVIPCWPALVDLWTAAFEIYLHIFLTQSLTFSLTVISSFFTVSASLRTEEKVSRCWKRKTISSHKKTGIIHQISCYCTRRLLYSAISPASLILANRSSDRNRCNRNHIANNDF